MLEGVLAMQMSSLRDLYQHQLAELRQAELEYLEALPTLQSAAYSYELGKAIHEQILQSQEHIQRIDRILNTHSSFATEEAPSTMGLARFCVELSQHPEAFPDVRDAALIAAIQRVRHEQIAGYGCARTWAQVLGDRDAGIVLQKCLTDEKISDAQLTRIAEGANRRAAAALVVA
jgi:ferritin-like metal-binding protein YciE